MRTTLFAVVTALTVAGWLGSLSAATWHIRPDGSGDAPTIQEGIFYLAQSGDTVLLAPGIYTGVGNRDIGFPRWGILVTSEAGPEATIIDCQGLGRAFILDVFPAVISGLTMTNGNSAAGLLPGRDGGAVYCDNASSPTEITNNIFIQNTATDGGGAIYCGNGTVVSITNNTFVENSAPERGGGIFCDGPMIVTISGNNLNGNTGGLGGGICCWFGLATISNNTLVGNTASSGGGIFCELTNSSSVVSYNTVTGNSATRGGGMSCMGDGTISYNVVCANHAQDVGGGIECFGGSLSPGRPLISQNTLSENTAPSGGGIFCYSSSAWPTIENTIIAFSTQGEAISCGSGAPTIARCNIYGNAGGDALCGIDGGNNFSLDPQFCGINGSGNYWLQSDSPCVPSLNPFNQLVGALAVGCGGVSTQEKTWGAVKALYRE